MGLVLLLQPHKPPNGPLDTPGWSCHRAFAPAILPTWNVLPQILAQLGSKITSTGGWWWWQGAFLEQPYPFCHSSMSFCFAEVLLPLPRIPEPPCLLVYCLSPLLLWPHFPGQRDQSADEQWMNCVMELGLGGFVTAPHAAAPSWPRPGHAACSPQRQPLHRVDTGLPRQDAGRGCLMFLRGQGAARPQSSGFPSKNTPGKQLFLFSRTPRADSCLRLPTPA